MRDIKRYISSFTKNFIFSKDENQEKNKNISSKFIKQSKSLKILINEYELEKYEIESSEKIIRKKKLCVSKVTSCAEN